MALGGSGASSDPYIVHDWAELLEAFSGADNNYIELANDIQAPDTAVTVSSTKTISLDGKDYAINGIHHSAASSAAITLATSSQNMVIKNIKFTSIYITGGYLISIDPSSTKRGTYQNISISGRIDSGVAIYTVVLLSGQTAYRKYATVDRIAVNLETSTGDIKVHDNYYDGSVSITNANIKLKYLNCSPQKPIIRKGSSSSNVWAFSNSLIDITAEQATANVDVCKIDNCCIIGKGHGVTYYSATGVNVVEDTLPVTTAANVHSLSTADIKDAETLHNLGFPIGAE